MAEGGAPEEIIQRISLAGGEDVIAQLAEIGKVGEDAFLRIVQALGPAGELLTGMATAITGIGAALGAWAHHSSEATEAVGNLAKQTGSTIEEISGLTGALSESGVSAGELGAAFRRLAITSENQWAEIRKSVKDSRDQMVNDHLAVQGSLQSVASAEVALRNAREELARLQGRTVPGDDPEIAMYRKRADARRAVQEAELKLAEAQQKSVEAAKKADEDRKNSMESVGAAVESIASGQKSFDEASKGANLEVGNVIKGILVAAKAGEEGGLGLKQFGGGLAELSTQGPKALDVFFKLADVMKNSGSASLNTALQVRLLGRSLGENFNAVLSKGSEATKEEIERLKSLGLVLTEVDEKVGKDFKISFSTLSDELSTTFTQVGNLFGPAFTEAMNSFRKTLEDNHGAIISFGKSIAEEAKPAILDFFRILSGKDAETSGGKGFQEMGAIISGVSKGIVSTLGLIADAFNAAFGTHFNAAIIGATAAIGGLALAFGGFPLAIVVAIGAAMWKLIEAAEKLKALKTGKEFGEAAGTAIGKQEALEDEYKYTEQIAANGLTVGENMEVAAKATEKTHDAASKAGHQYEELGKKGAAAGESISKAMGEAAKKTVSPEVEARRQSISAAGGINLSDLVYHPPSGPPPPRPATEHAQFKTVADTLRQLGIGTPPKPTGGVSEPEYAPPRPAEVPSPVHPATLRAEPPVTTKPIKVEVVEGEAGKRRDYGELPPYKGPVPLGSEAIGTPQDLRVPPGSSPYREPTDPNVKPLHLRVGKEMMGDELVKALKDIEGASTDQLQKTLQVIRGLKPGEADITAKGLRRDEGALFPPGPRDYVAPKHIDLTGPQKSGYTDVSFPGPTVSQQQYVEAELRRRQDLERAQERARSSVPQINPPSAAPEVQAPKTSKIEPELTTAQSAVKAFVTELVAAPGQINTAIDTIVSTIGHLGESLGGLADKITAPGGPGSIPQAAPAPTADTGSPEAQGGTRDTSSLDKAATSSDSLASGLDTAVGAVQAFISALTSFSAASKASPSPSPSPAGFASGTRGPIQGPGTSKSDSILARVSVGEHIVAADGSNLMDVVSHFAGSFSVGGLIERMNLPRFAGGGAVARAAAGAGGHGRPLVLDFSGAGGGKYTARMDHDTAESLTKFAIRKNMVSGGKKPSWFG